MGLPRVFRTPEISGADRISLKCSKWVFVLFEGTTCLWFVVILKEYQKEHLKLSHPFLLVGSPRKGHPNCIWGGLPHRHFAILPGGSREMELWG